jgi:serine/threonine protein phosphatase PrpC
MAYVIPKDPQVMMKKGALFIVADGMGGHAAGEVASEIAVDTVSYAYYQEDSDDIAASLVHSIKRANTLIHQRAAENMLRSGMGTTCVAGVLRGGVAYIANVGDSRTYLVRHGQVRQVSQDHSWVAEQVRAGLLTEEQARSHAQRNVITRCLGTQADVEVDIFAEPLEEGDSFVLCSDGLSGFVTDDDLRAIVNQYVPQESVYHLVERANENGGPDNITAIVVHVQEVGWEPAPARLNGYANGRDVTSQTTLTDAQMVNGGTHNGNGHLPSGPLHLSTGPLDPSESITAPQPAISTLRRGRGRLLYPSLVLFVLLIVTLVGSGIYYFQHLNSPANFDTSYTDARNLVLQSKQDIAKNNPTLALQHLSKAQTILHTLQGNSLSDAQNKQVNGLLSGDFTATAKSAITNYNAQSLIMSVACPNKVTTAVNNGSTNTLASGVASIQNGNGSKTFFYTLGEDGNIYQLNNQESLQNPYMLPTNTKIQTLASDGGHLLALSSSSTSTTATPTYTVVWLTPDDNTGVLKTTNASVSIGGDDTKNGFAPKLLTAQGTEVYVVLTSDISLTSAKILHYTVDSKNSKFEQTKTSQTISISNTIESIAAFPNEQLFLLTKDGNVQSLTFTGGTQAPTLVTVQPALAAPLAFNANTFTASTPVAVPTPTAKQSTVLQVPSAKYLIASATATNDPLHLYIVDDTTYHRIIDLQMVKNATNGTNSTSGTSMTMKLIQQYASPNLFVNVKGTVLDPKTATLYFIVQNEQNAATRNFVTLNTGTPTTCTP